MLNRSMSCLLTLVFLVPACRSSKSRNHERPASINVLADESPLAEPFGYYKMRRTMNGFFNDVPTFVDILPDEYLSRGHVVQLLSANFMDGWARVRTEEGKTGYVKYDNIRIVPVEDQPKPKRRDSEAELDKLLQQKR